MPLSQGNDHPPVCLVENRSANQLWKFNGSHLKICPLNQCWYSSSNVKPLIVSRGLPVYWSDARWDQKSRRLRWIAASAVVPTQTDLMSWRAIFLLNSTSHSVIPAGEIVGFRRPSLAGGPCGFEPTVVNLQRSSSARSGSSSLPAVLHRHGRKHGPGINHVAASRGSHGNQTPNPCPLAAWIGVHML